MELFQVNTKFLNSLPPEWSKFVTDVKLVKDLHTSNYDQLHAYLEQHELHANEVRLMCERNQDPLAFIANQQMTPYHFNTLITQVDYQSPQAPTQLMTESSFVDSGFSVPVFSLGDDPIACINKAMAFLTPVASSRVTVQQVQGRQRQNYSSTTYKDNATSSRGNTTSGQARVIKCYNYQEAQEAGQILDEEQLAFLADSGILTGQVQTIIPHNAAFQTEDLDTYDSDCDDLSNAQAVLMANISNYGYEVISEVPNSGNYLNDMDNQKQMINHVNNLEKANKEQHNESITAELERYKERVKTFEQRLNIDLSFRKKMIDSQMDDMIKEKLALKEKMKPTLYDESVISEKHVAMPVIDNEETLISKEKSRSKMSKKAKDPQTVKENISHKPIDYEKVEVPIELPKRSESCEKCLNLDAEFSKSKQEYNDLLNKYSQLEKHCISLEVSMQLKQEVFQKDEFYVCQNAPKIPEYFEMNDLKAQLKDKDTTI
nr:hypothetical protein [Tanacetum cinerariifolium]